MNTKWLISDHVKDKKFEMNISNYSSLFINESTNFYDLIMKLHEYFKPRTKMRDYITIKESTNDFEEISNHAYYSFIISESILEDEKQLKNKSLLKDHIKNKLLNNLETNGYLLTVNTLLGDLFQETLSEIPYNFDELSIDKLLKTVNIRIESNSNYNEDTIDIQLTRKKELLNLIKQHVTNEYKQTKIIFYMFPESNLSPRNQIKMREFLEKLSEEIYVFVITKSKYFLQNDHEGVNYLYSNSEKQLFNESFFDDLEWDCPVDYKKEKLIESVKYVYKTYVDTFETTPLISNYKNADIILFESIDLFVLTFILKKLNYKYYIDLDAEKIDNPVYKYILDIYENI